jgi:hypothetical protein
VQARYFCHLLAQKDAFCVLAHIIKDKVDFNQ